MTIPEWRAATDEERAALRTYTGSLTKRRAQAFALFDSGCSVSGVSKTLGLSRGRAREIIEHALADLDRDRLIELEIRKGITRDSPFWCLNPSVRLWNAAHHMVNEGMGWNRRYGDLTIGEVLAAWTWPYKHVGKVTRDELISALRTHGVPHPESHVLNH